MTRRSAADHSWIQPEISSKCGKVSSTTVFLDLPLTPVRFQLHKCHSKGSTALGYGFTRLPFRPGSQQVEENRPIVSSPFSRPCPAFPPPFSPPLFSFPRRLISSQVQDPESGLFEEEEIWSWVNIRAPIARITTPIYHSDKWLFSG